MEHDLLFLVLASIFLAMAIALLWTVQRLRQRHPETFAQLKLENLDAATRGPLRFLWRREYLLLHDPTLTRLSEGVRLLLAAYVFGFAAIFAWAIYADWRRDNARAGARSSPAAEGRRHVAYELHRNHRWAEAAAIYDELLGEAGNDAELAFWRGNARWRLRRYDEALADYRRVMDLAPENFEAYLHADRILSMQRRFDDCVDLWTRFLRVVPGHAEAHLERGGSHYHRGDLDSALADTRKACELGKAKACDFARSLEVQRAANEAKKAAR